MKILTPFLVVLTMSFAFGAETTSDIAAHNPKVQKAKQEYRTAESGETYLAALNAVLKLQEKHRKIYDAIKLGDSVFTHEGLLTLGEIRYEQKQGYRLTFGFRPREAGENAIGITALIVHFDDEGLITKKTIPRYKW